MSTCSLHLIVLSTVLTIFMVMDNTAKICEICVDILVILYYNV